MIFDGLIAALESHEAPYMVAGVIFLYAAWRLWNRSQSNLLLILGFLAGVLLFGWIADGMP